MRMTPQVTSAWCPATLIISMVAREGLFVRKAGTVTQAPTLSA